MSLEIVEMPNWKSRVLTAVAWLIGIRGEEAMVITVSKGWRDKMVSKDTDV